MKIGDLVCYNAGGQKYKTLGLVVGFENIPTFRYKDLPPLDKLVHIHWVVLPKVGPAVIRSKTPLGASFTNAVERRLINQHPACWHRVGDWFEVISCK